MIMTKENTVWVMIDFQERLMPAMQHHHELAGNVAKLAKGGAILGVPRLVTQQYTKGLGGTVAGIADALGNFDPIEKTSFSAWGEPVFREELERHRAVGRTTAVVSGIEAHVCVMQTVLDLLEEGYRVAVVADGVSSRTEMDRVFALSRMAAAGATVTTVEAILFELLKGAGDPAFKQISQLVK